MSQLLAAISGHCARQAVVEAEQAFVFTCHGLHLALVDDHRPHNSSGVFLFVSDQDYADLRSLLRPTVVV